MIAPNRDICCQDMVWARRARLRTMSAEPLASTEAPYDRWATDYRDWWAPVIAPAGVRTLDRLASRLGAGAPRSLLDVGAGTGTVALAALRRWPDVQVVAIDPARTLLAMADASARDAGVEGRLRTLVGEAGRLPLDDGSMDAAISTFVLQLTPNRSSAVREVFRVLAPGGTFAHLTWRIDEEPWEPEDVFDDALDALRIEPPERSGGGSDRSYPSPRTAATELRRAGFASVDAREEWIEHRFSPQGYLDLAEHWTEDDTFASLDEPMRRRLRAEVLRRLERLPASALVWRRPLVSAVGTKPG
jgi:SAM-dependent methyltransferase